MKLLALLIALASAEPSAPAAGVLVSVKAPVRVQRSGASAPTAELGM